jgi:plasmid maintenance system antidote protein VapI
MTPIQNSIAYIQGFEFGQDIAKKEMRLAVEAEREACAQIVNDDRGLSDDDAIRVCRAIRARGNT